MAKHARGIAEAEVIKNLPVNARQRRARSRLSDNWEWGGPIEHPMKRNALEPALRLFCLHLGFRVSRDEARDFAFAHVAYGLAVDHKRSRIA